jgi:5-methylcytosine-specific restriction protein A
MPQVAQTLGEVKGYVRLKDFRPSSCERGYGSRWQRASKQYLICNPLCVECEKRGETKLATCVDHIKPHRGNMKLFWLVSNWQSLCEADHNRKTARGE